MTECFPFSNFRALRRALHLLMQIDHVIPVMLINASAEPPNFGPLYDDWDDMQIEEARRHVAWIVINSKNWTDLKNGAMEYITANNSNIMDCEDGLRDKGDNSTFDYSPLQEYRAKYPSFVSCYSDIIGKHGKTD